MQRAQMSVFLILAVVMLTGVLVLITAKQQELPQSFPVQGDDRAAAVHAFVQSCVEQATVKGVIELGLTGGVVIPFMTRPSKVVNDRYVALYRIGDDILDVKRSDLEGYLGEWIAVYARGCMDGLTLPVRSLPLVPKVRASIGDAAIDVTANIPIVVPGASADLTVNPDYASRVPVRVWGLIEEARKWALDEKATKGMANLSRLLQWRKNQWRATVVPWDAVTTVVLIEDESQHVAGSSFAFQFATSRGGSA